MPRLAAIHGSVLQWLSNLRILHTRRGHMRRTNDVQMSLSKFYGVSPLLTIPIVNVAASIRESEMLLLGLDRGWRFVWMTYRDPGPLSSACKI